MYAYDVASNFTLMSKNPLVGFDDFDELRGMVLLPDGQLVVAQAGSKDSALLFFSACSADSHTRKYSHSALEQLDHPYSVTFRVDSKGALVLFAANQHTNDVTSYDADGNFLAVLESFKTDQIRGLAYDSTLDVLFVADEDADTVYGYSFANQSISKTYSYSFQDPVKVFLDVDTRVLYIGQRKLDSVATINLATNKPGPTYSNAALVHPAGIAVSGDRLFVVSQKLRTVVEFSITTGDFKGTVISGLTDDPEQIRISPC
eukprot:gnl/Spiro4/9284_TR4893_c0_g1_i1.p1 gnl/Spiro4/9284_TR4893_c0_g1~~gnl/Spiro4/9284_TR4893_c0_g1_i1.p1  ORF type:complete len:303 (+),score=39.36 gnl/Spiro4/9284_TR4893_c0_g1_i1:132-911(+)